MAKILVIEDNAEVRSVLVRLLSRHGHEVIEADDGRTGIYAYRTQPSDLVVTDLIMPGKEGLETIIELRQEYPDLKIIAISGGGDCDKGNYLRAAKLCGATHVFRKPFDLDEFVKTVDKLLMSENSM